VDNLHTVTIDALTEAIQRRSVADLFDRYIILFVVPFLIRIHAASVTVAQYCCSWMMKQHKAPGQVLNQS
jgi:hypothetical protein